MHKAHVIIYSRPGCHLCDEAKAAIESAGCSDSFTLEEVNIESDQELLKKYKYDIPSSRSTAKRHFFIASTPKSSKPV